MKNLTFSIVITTYNRASLLKRAIDAIAKQKWPNLEIIVIDDASKDTLDYFDTWPELNIVYHRLKENGGPCHGRNMGINMAKNNWIIIEDDDDELMPNALNKIASILNANAALSGYPVINFRCSNGQLDSVNDYLIVKPVDYFENRIRGDFTPVINRSLFLRYKLEYPNLKIGGESLLWLEVASQWGIPTYNEIVLKLNEDAVDRLTSGNSAIHNATALAEYQEQKLSKFSALFDQYPCQRKKICRGLITYCILADNKKMARQKIKQFFSKENLKLESIIFYILTILPLSIVKSLFLFYRKSLA